MKFLCMNCQGDFIPLVDGRFECTQCGGKVSLAEEGLMDEQHALDMAELALRSDARLLVDLPLRSIWLLMSACQMTVTHPGLHDPLIAAYEQIGRHLQAQILERLPEVEELAEAGWDRESDFFDVLGEDD